jgi:hypothetical protein
MNKTLKKIALVIGYLLGIFLIFRTIAEPFVIDLGNPETYKHDWGGPMLVGVLAVHMLPGILALVLIVIHLKRVSINKRSLSKPDDIHNKQEY